VPAREDRYRLQCRQTSSSKEGGIAYLRARQRRGVSICWRPPQIGHYEPYTELEFMLASGRWRARAAAKRSGGGNIARTAHALRKLR